MIMRVRELEQGGAGGLRDARHSKAAGERLVVVVPVHCRLT
jgi:hypothetical protein